MTREFMVPVKTLIVIRDELKRRGQAAVATTEPDSPVPGVWHTAAKMIQEAINNARAAGKGAARWDDPTVEERAVARLLQLLAEQSDRWAAELTERLDGLGAHHRMSVEGERDTVVRRAQRLWHALLIVMEHTGLGPEDMLTPEDLDRQLSPVQPVTGHPTNTSR